MAENFDLDLIDLGETDFAPLHPGVLILREMDKLDIDAELFANICNIDVTEVKNVISRQALPSNLFIDKSKAIFGEKFIFIIAERDVFIHYLSRHSQSLKFR